jgi:WhiB family redox-sensing transcriptional regulator
MTGKIVFFGNGDRQRAWLELANKVAEVGIDHIPCAQAPDLFFPEADPKTGHPLNHIRTAKKACKACPLLLDCATYAIKYNEDDGVWGGMSPGERKQIRRRRYA